MLTESVVPSSSLPTCSEWGNGFLAHGLFEPCFVDGSNAVGVQPGDGALDIFQGREEFFDVFADQFFLELAGDEVNKVHKLGLWIHGLTVSLEHHLPVEEMHFQMFDLITFGVVLERPQAAGSHLG